MKKKLWIVAVIVSIMLGVCACGKEPASAESTEMKGVEEQGNTQSGGVTESSQENVSAEISTDWHSAGFYLNGQYAKLPMTCDELAAMGFDRFNIWDTENAAFVETEELVLQPYEVCSARVYNAGGEYVTVDILNEQEQELDFKDCTIYRITFGTENALSDVGLKNGSLCNDLKIGDSYEDIVESMGTPDEEVNTMPDLAFCGSLNYFFDTSSRMQYVEILLFENKLYSVEVRYWPVDFYDRQWAYQKQQNEAKQESAQETQSAENTGGETYYVKLLEVGSYKIKVIQAYRDATGAELADAKAAVEAAPCLVLETTNLTEAEQVAQAFRDAGATIDEDMSNSEFSSVQ